MCSVLGTCCSHSEITFTPGSCPVQTQSDMFSDLVSEQWRDGDSGPARWLFSRGIRRSITLWCRTFCFLLKENLIMRSSHIRLTFSHLSFIMLHSSSSYHPSCPSVSSWFHHVVVLGLTAPSSSSMPPISSWKPVALLLPSLIPLTLHILFSPSSPSLAFLNTVYHFHRT